MESNVVIEEQKHKGRKGGSKKASTPVEVKNNLLSKSYAKVLVAVGEGEFAGVPTARDIFLNGTPLESSTGLQNFGGVKWEWRSGRSDQTYITGMPEVSNEYPVSYTLTNLVPYTRLFTNSELDATRVTISFPALLKQQDNGDIVGYNIEYAIDVSTDGGVYVEQGRWDTATGKTTVEYNRTHRINFPRTGTSWTLRVRRLTPNQNNAKIQDTMTVKSVSEVIDAKFRYPNTALLYVEFDAELFGGTSIPAISLKTKGRYIQVPSNYNPTTRVYSGIWNGAYKWAWSDNPAWIFYDIVTNERFGLGSRITPEMVNKWNLYQIAQYCDVMVPNGEGGTEPRHTCNVYIQSRKEAWQVLRDIVAIFNGMLHWNGTQMVATADMPVDVTTVRTYSRANVVDGKFTYGTPSEKTVYTTAMVSFDDPANHYKTAVEPVNDLNLVRRWKSWSQAELTAIGCTSRGQAQRKGKYAMVTNSLNRLVNFKVGMEGYLPAPGDVIGVADQTLAGAQLSGRITSATINSVTTDRDPTAVPGDILYINKADGVAGEGRTVLSVVGRKITTTSNFSAIPQIELTWYVEKTTLKSQLYRVNKIGWDDEAAEYTISATQYEDSKYAAIDSGARLESRPITNIPAGGQVAPTGLVLSSFTYIEQTMAVTNLSVKWNPAEGAMNYEAEWRKDGGDWLSVGLTASTGFDVRGIYSGAYQARVRAINSIGTKSVWVESTNTQLTGKVGAPPTLVTFATVPEVFGIRLNWAFQPGSDDGAFIQLQQATTLAGANASELSLVAYPAQTYVKSNMMGGVVGYFRGRLIDRTGNQSAWTPWTYGISEYGTDKILESITGEIERTQLGDTLLSELDATALDLNKGKLDISWLEAQVTGLEQQVQNSVDDLDRNLADLDGNLAVLNDDVTALHGTVDVLQGQLDAAVTAAEYDPTKTYATGDIIRKGQRLYQALSAVPINNTPPNITYWKDVGQTLTEAGATAAQVQINTATITTQGNTITSQASQLSGLTTRVTNAENTITGQGTAISNLSSTVTSQGNTITSQGQAITSVTSTVNGIGGSGTNLLEDKYSWLGVSSPTVSLSTAMPLSTVADAASASGFRYRLERGSSANPWAMFCPSNNTAGWNIQLTAGKYLVSFYANTDTTGVTNGLVVRAALWDGSSKGATDFPLTTTRTRYTAVVTLATDTKAAVTLFFPAGATSDVILVDSIMVERQLASSTVPSAFTSGSSAGALTATASAVTGLTTRVTNAEGTITSQGTAITTLKNSLGGTGTNLVPALYSTFSATKPEIVYGSTIATTVADAEAFNGYALKVTSNSTNATATIYTAPTETYDGFNMACQQGKYILSYWAKAETAGHTIALFLRGRNAASAINTGGASQDALTTTWTRYSQVVDMTGSIFADKDKLSIGVQINRSGVTGRVFYMDRIMLEKQVGDGTAPSPYTQGNSFGQATATSEAVTGLTSRVTSAEGSITSQGSSITSLNATVDGIGGSGTNLVDDGYSWITATSLPPLNNYSLTSVGVALPASASGFAYQFTYTGTVTNARSIFGNAAAIPMQLTAGKYIISFYASANVAAQVQPGFSDPLASSVLTGAILAVGTTRGRYSAVVTVPVDRTANVILYINRAGTSGVVLTVDSVMVERQLGNNTLPSPFVPGSSAIALTGAVTATSALTARVTSAEGSITSQGNSITNLQASVGNVLGENLLLDPTFANTTGLSSAAVAVVLPRNDASVPAGSPSSRVTKITVPTSGNMYYSFLSALNVRTPENGNSAQIAVAPGEVYDFELYAYTVTTRGQCGLWIQYYDTAGTSTGHNWTVQSGDGLNISTEIGKWVKFTGQSTVPANCIRMAMCMRYSTGDATDTFLSSPVVRKRPGQDNGLAQATSALEARVTTAEGNITSQSTSITNLNTSLTTTNSNVTTAQNAANAANTLAGGKGKVLVQTATPAAADQLVQNLWIDITGGANTPKRWTGSAWTAVTDKVATDAATAAANALSVANTKADSSALTSLTSRVTAAEGNITSQGSSITALNATVSGIGGAGTNLLPAEYGAYTATAPVTSTNSAYTPTTEADTAAFGGYALKITTNSTVNGTLYLVPSGSAGITYAHANMGLKRGKYIISYSARTNVAGHTVAPFLKSYNTDNSNVNSTINTQNQALTTSWARYSAVIDMTSAAHIGDLMLFCMQVNVSLTAGRIVWIDKVMVEAMIGENTTPSAFVIGNSFYQIGGQASATSALTARVTTAEGAITSQGNSITNLTATLGSISTDNIVNDPSFMIANNTVTSSATIYTRADSTTPADAPTERVLRIPFNGTGNNYLNFKPTSTAKAMVVSFETVACKPGDVFTFSCWVYTEGTTARPVQLYMSFTNDPSVGSFATHLGGAATVCDGAWTKLTYTFTVPANNRYMLIRMRYLPGAVVVAWIADPQLNMQSAEAAAQAEATTSLTARVTSVEGTVTSQSTQITNLTAGVSNVAVDNLLLDPTFATTNGLAGVAAGVVLPRNDASVPAGSPSTRVVKIPIAFATGNTYYGFTSATNVRTPENTGSTQIAVSPGEVYDFELYSYVTTSRGQCGLWIQFTTTAGASFGHTWAVQGGDGVNTSTEFGKWVKFTGQATVPADCIRMAMVVRYSAGNATDVFISSPVVRKRGGQDNGLAQATSAIEARVTTAEGSITAQASSITNLGTQLTTANTNITAQGNAITALTTTVNNVDGKVDAVTKDVRTISAQARQDNGSGDLADAIQLWQNTAAIQTERIARADQDGSFASDMTTVTAIATDAGTAAGLAQNTADGAQYTANVATAQVQTVSTAVANLNGQVSASYSIKLGVSNDGRYYAAGMGIGIENTPAGMQSQVLFLADRFAVMNTANGATVTPFAIQGGQVIINNALIGTATITNAMIADAQITSAKIGTAQINTAHIVNASVDTLKIRGNSVTVPTSATTAGTILGAGVNNFINVVAVGVQMDDAGYIMAQFGCYQGFGNGIRRYMFQMDINGQVMATGGGDWADGFPNLLGSIAVAPGYFVITVKWWGENSGVGISNSTLYAMGTKR